MSIQFCVVRRKEDGFVLCNKYEPGYHYSEYTHANASVDQGYIDIMKCMGPQDYIDEDQFTMVIFESREKASNWISTNHAVTSWRPGDAPDKYEILSFAEIDEIVEKMFLTDKLDENE